MSDARNQRIETITDAVKPLPCPFAESLRKTREGMLTRCYSETHVHYHDYGGRGISVCDSWRQSLDAFAWDVGERPSSDHQLDRVDNNGNYAPDNVRWATRKEQHRNKRNNRHLTAFGETLTLAEWAERTGMRKQTIRMRLVRGWSVEQALSEEPSLDGSRHMTPAQRSERSRASWRTKRCKN